MERRWTHGNQLDLLENGEEFFPSVFAAIAEAEHEIIIETFIWRDDGVGWQLQEALLAAARRGVSVDITVDGFGSANLATTPHQEFVSDLAEAGVRLHVYGPLAPIMGLQTNLFRRLHRKLVVIDGRLAFIGGINYSDEHVRSFGAMSKQDFAVRARGPVVDDIHAFCRTAIGESHRPRRRRSLRGLLRKLPRGWSTPSSNAQVLFVTRDNHNQRTAIEAMYRMGLRSAVRDIVIMNAYFFPGWRFLRAMRQAVQRGVRVRLVLQGEPDKPYVKFAGATLYDGLLDIGVEIWEFMERPAHAKVAVMDDHWATVGSSNLDPFSLSLNLEANLFIRDADFARRLRDRLEALLASHARRVTRSEVARRHPVWHLWRWVGYHLLRHFPKLAGLIPERPQPLTTLGPPPLDPQALGPQPPGPTPPGDAGAMSPQARRR